MTNCLVFNLATADMLLAITIPVVMFTRVVEQWKLGNTACKLVPYIQVSWRYFKHTYNQIKFTAVVDVVRIALESRQQRNYLVM